MTVKELIEFLQEYDEEAHVFIMQQPNWPFEFSIQGIISRREIFQNNIEYDENGEPEEELNEEDWPKEVSYSDRWGANKLPLNDVFILEGTQLCYGSKNAW